MKTPGAHAPRLKKQKSSDGIDRGRNRAAESFAQSKLLIFNMKCAHENFTEKGIAFSISKTSEWFALTFAKVASVLQDAEVLGYRRSAG